MPYRLKISAKSVDPMAIGAPGRISITTQEIATTSRQSEEEVRTTLPRGRWTASISSFSMGFTTIPSSKPTWNIGILG